MKRREFSKKVKKQIIDRATNGDGQICCEGCSVVMGFKKYDIDHVLPDGLQADKRKLTPDDGQLLCKPCHREKTRDDVKKIRKADRTKNRHRGLVRGKQKIPGKSLPSGAKRLSTASVLPELPKRSLFKPKER